MTYNGRSPGYRSLHDSSSRLPSDKVNHARCLQLRGQLWLSVLDRSVFPIDLFREPLQDHQFKEVCILAQGNKTVRKYPSSINRFIINTLFSEADPMYTTLDANKITDTIETLQHRIEERFPQSGLAEVCAALNQIAHQSTNNIAEIVKPNQYVRVGVAAIILLSLIGVVVSFNSLSLSFRISNITELMQVSESAINELVLIGAALFFLFTIEARIKRNRALPILHELRVIAHVIDMYQLTKDPSTITDHIHPTKSSPKRTMTTFELARYLDYCSEMLSLTAKISALYAQHLKDEVILNTVNEIEMLTSGLSRKIWQKIMLLHHLVGGSD